MNKRKSIALMAALMALLTMIGCSKKSDKPAAQRKQAVSAATGGSWKTDTSDHTITWFFAYDWYGKKFNPAVNTFDKWVYDETGCKIDIQTGDVAKLNMLIKTGKLPDIITLDANSSQRTLLENNGMVLPLNKLCAEYAPDLIVPQSMVEWYTAPDGNWYSIASFYYGNDNIKDNNGFFETHNQNFVRDDILKQIGMTYDDLHTKEGFLKALRAVKKQNIKYKGNTLVPYMLFFDDIGAEQVAEQLGASMETADGKYQSLYRAPEFLEAMLLCNEMYREGLLTDESLTANKAQIEQKVAAGTLFAVTAHSLAVIARNSLYSMDNNAKLMYAGQYMGDKKAPIKVSAKSNMGWTATLINKNAKHPERIIRLFAFFNTKEATLNQMWGVGGWELKDGMVVRTPELLKLYEENNKEWEATIGASWLWTSDYTVIQGTYPRDNTVFSDDVYLQTHDPSITVFDDKCFYDVSPEAGSEEAAIDARIMSYKKQAVARMVTASSAAQCKSEYEKAIKEMEGLGLVRLEEYRNKRFQDNKKRLGLTRAYPQ